MSGLCPPRHTASCGGFTAAVGRPGPKRTNLRQRSLNFTLNRYTDAASHLPFSVHWEMVQAQ